MKLKNNNYLLGNFVGQVEIKLGNYIYTVDIVESENGVSIPKYGYIGGVEECKNNQRIQTHKINYQILTLEGYRRNQNNIHINLLKHKNIKEFLPNNFILQENKDIFSYYNSLIDHKKSNIIKRVTYVIHIRKIR